METEKRTLALLRAAGKTLPTESDPAVAFLETVHSPQPAPDSTVRTVLRQVFSFPAFLGALLVMGVFASVCLNLQGIQSLPDAAYHISIFEGDTWYHILEGEGILQTHAWPTKDSYSFTAHGNDAVAYEWFGDVGIALVARLGGLRALAGLLLTLAAALMLLAYYYAHLRCGSSKAAFVACAALLPLASAFFTLRPQLLGYIFLLITLICLELFRRGNRKALWVLPGVFALWANIHPAFMLGIFILGVHWLAGLVDFRCGALQAERWTASQRRQLLAVLFLCLLALTLTPYGTRLAAFPLDYIRQSPLGIAHIVEYQPLESFGSLLQGFLAVLMLFLIGNVAARPVYRLEEIGLLLLAICGACVHLRLLLFLVIVFAPLLALLLARWIPQYDTRTDRYILNAVLMLLISVGLVRFFPSSQALEKVVASGFPSGAVRYLQQHPVAERMLNDDLWGAYLIRSLGPAHKVFIDGRSQLYEEAGVFGDYLRIMSVDRETLVLLRKYGLEACLIPRAAPLATLLAALPDWKLAYGDQLSVLFVRREETALQR